MTPVYYDYAGRLDWNLHENGRLGVFAIGSSDTLHVLDQDPDVGGVDRPQHLGEVLPR